MTMKIISLFLILTLLTFASIAQPYAKITGTVKDEKAQALEMVNIGITNLNKPIGTLSSAKGQFELDVPANQELVLKFSFTGYEPVTIKLNLSEHETYNANIRLKISSTNIEGTTVRGSSKSNTFTQLNPLDAHTIPGIIGGVESLIKSLPGVNSNNELSSQYSVRGGNFDENLVYVNDIEIYRPLLTRSGEQEGLSFANSDLISTLQFSGGGFDAKYGDKLSSVLDIQYKTPSTFKGSLSLNLMGGSAHIEGSSNKQKFTYLFGVRQKSNQYILNSLETKGDYKPSFTDIQTLVTYQINKKNKLSFLGNVSLNKYLLIPQSRQTKFGHSEMPLRFTVYFDGQEVDKYQTWFGALSWNNTQSSGLHSKITFTGYRTWESETFDIQGQYRLSEIDNNLSSETYGEETYNLGIGTYLNHARNYLDAIVSSLDYKATYEGEKAIWYWGAKFQYEDILDELNEWKLVDSAGYSLPEAPLQPGESNPDKNPPLLQNLYLANHHTTSTRWSGYGQLVYDFDSSKEHLLNVGARFSYWSLNREFIFSPRASYSYKPKSHQDLLFKLSSGLYAQPPFYREIRDIYGNIHPETKAQKSVHVVAGLDYYLRIWDRPFKLTSELYYKYLYDLIPYEIDNLRIRYMATNSSSGYAVGGDFRLMGDFVPGTESWFGLSIMKTSEDISYMDRNGVTKNTGYIPRPTDQLLSANLFFQDYVTKNENIKVFINLIFATGLPNGSGESLNNPDLFIHRAGERLPSYKRVDVGTSYLLLQGKHFKGKTSFIQKMWIGMEIFNLFQMKNTISYTWISVIDGGQYGVPNHLTPRQLNVKLTIEF